MVFLFGSRIKMKSLALVCRMLSTLLEAGVPIQKSFKLVAAKTSDVRCRQALEEVADGIGRGDEVSSAMRAQGGAFPLLLVDMVAVAEQTGALPEILISLANHYDNHLRLRRMFRAQIAWPVFQLVAAILIVAFLIFVLGIIAESSGGKPVDVLGLGLYGTNGAIFWLTATFGSVFGLFVAYKMTIAALGGKKVFDPLLLRVPVLGPCMRSFAIARFSWSFALTQQSGMAIGPSLEASLQATNNGAFRGAWPAMWGQVQAGDRLSDAMADSGLFPDDFMHMVDVAETSGTVPEALERLSPQFEEQARRSLSALTVVLGWVVWLIVAVFIVYLIFSIVMRMYIGPLNEALQDAM